VKKTMFRIFVIGSSSRAFSPGRVRHTGVTKADLDGAKDLAKRFVDSINRKDLDGTMACI